MHGQPFRKDWVCRMSYIVKHGRYRENLALELPHHSYQADWIEPRASSLLRSDKLTHAGGIRIMTTPTYSIDIALRLVANG